jgi:oligoribonuclease (3'-5' exoribonuclease)
MHTKNGLWEACQTGADCYDAEADALAWLDSLKCDEPFTLAGSSVHFDLSFLREGHAATCRAVLTSIVRR